MGHLPGPGRVSPVYVRVTLAVIPEAIQSTSAAISVMLHCEATVTAWAARWTARRAGISPHVLIATCPAQILWSLIFLGPRTETVPSRCYDMHGKEMTSVKLRARIFDPGQSGTLPRPAAAYPNNKGCTHMSTLPAAAVPRFGVSRASIAQIRRILLIPPNRHVSLIQHLTTAAPHLHRRITLTTSDRDRLLASYPSPLLTLCYWV